MSSPKKPCLLQGFYTSEFDLSEFYSNKYSIGISYTDIFTKMHIWRFYMKNADLRYSHYTRNHKGFSQRHTKITFIFTYLFNKLENRFET